MKFAFWQTLKLLPKKKFQIDHIFRHINPPPNHGSSNLAVMEPESRDYDWQSIFDWIGQSIYFQLQVLVFEPYLNSKQLTVTRNHTWLSVWLIAEHTQRNFCRPAILRVLKVRSCRLNISFFLNNWYICDNNWYSCRSLMDFKCSRVIQNTYINIKYRYKKPYDMFSVCMQN